MQVEKLSGNPKPLDIPAKINQIIDNMVVSINGSGTDGNGNINIATIPVGFNYVQYPGESAPADLFGGEWENISSQFAGQFFRCEGGNAAAFGGTQGGGAPNIQGTFGNSSTFQTVTGAFLSSSSGNGTVGGYSYAQGTVVVGFSAANSNAIYGAADEIRPANSTIRIWKRTA